MRGSIHSASHVISSTVRRRHRAGATLALLVALIGSMTVVVPGALAHGFGDQAIGDPAGSCSDAEYPGSKLVTLEESRQSFVPSRGGLASVEVCIQNLVGAVGTDFTVTIYEGGSAATPGPAIGAVDVDAGTAILSAQWVHIDLPDVVPTTPGATYVLGLDPATGPLSSVAFQWLATCSDSVTTSCDGVEDAYPQGSTSDLPGNADYALRTFPLYEADLIGAVDVTSVVCPGQPLAGLASGTVTNTGETSVGGFATQWWVSDDPLLSPDDLAVDGARNDVAGPLAAGASLTVPPPTAMPAELADGTWHLLLEVDVDGVVVESAEGNNLAAGATQVTRCGEPDLTGLALDVDEDTVPTGYGEVQFADLDWRGLAFGFPQSVAEGLANPGLRPNGISPLGISPLGISPNGISANGISPLGISSNGISPLGISPLGISPLGISPLGISPLGISPNGVSPLGELSLGVILDRLDDDVLAGMSLVNIPGPSWSGLLADRTSEPDQLWTLLDVKRLVPSAELPLLYDVDLSRVLTADSIAYISLGGVIDDTPLADGRNLCEVVAEHGTTCMQIGIDPAQDPLLKLELAGVLPRTELAGLPPVSLAEATYTSSWLVGALPLAGTHRFFTEMTRFGARPLVELVAHPDDFANCAASDCTRPIAELAAEGLLLDNTVDALLTDLTAAGKAAVTVGDLANGVMGASYLNLATANHNLTNSCQINPDCPTATVHLTGDNTGTAAATGVVAEITLAPGFVYAPGTARLAVDGGAPAATGEPTTTLDTTDGTRTLAFVLDGAVVDSSFDLTIEVAANLYLGHFPIGSAEVSWDEIGMPRDSATIDPTSVDTVRVVERTPGVTTAATTRGNNIVIADHLAPNEFDSWTLDVPTQPRSLVMATLYPPAGVDLDLVAYLPQNSADAFTSDAFSPLGISPLGISPLGISPLGISPLGISPLGISPLGISPNGSSGDGAPVNGGGYLSTPDETNDVPVDEMMPAEGASGRYITSANHGDAPERILFYSSYGDEGHYTFAVADANGQGTVSPAFLTIQTFAPDLDPALGVCDTPSWDLSEPAGSAPAAWSGSEGPKTLFVTNQQVTSSAYGAAEAGAGIAALEELAARPEVRGIVLAADHDPDVQAAYGYWHEHWCDPAAATAAAQQVRDLILDLRLQHPTIDTVVLAGGDDVLPSFRLVDYSLLGNEIHYANALLKAYGSNNPTVAAFANGAVMTVDPYGAQFPFAFGGTLNFGTVSAGVSRLVETPADWVAQVQQYIAADGLLDPSAGFVSGYDGMVDGAHAAAEALEGQGIPTTLLTDETGSWDADQFRADAFAAGPEIAGYNAHANHWGLLSDAGSALADNGAPDEQVAAELVATDELAGIPFGGFVFSNGCHLGTPAPDAYNEAPSAYQATRLLDWAQAITGAQDVGGTPQRQGIAVANAGFGIFDTAVIGQGELLQSLFIEELATAANASLALTQAKTKYLATTGAIFDAYHFKTVHQLSLYGLGILRMPGATDAALPTPAPDADAIPVSAGPYAVAPTPCTDCIHPTDVPGRGTLYELEDASAYDTTNLAVSGYPSVTKLTQAITLPAGRGSAGLWFTGFDWALIADHDPVISVAEFGDPANEVEPQNIAAFPSKPAYVLDAGGVAYATTALSHFQPHSIVNGEVIGDTYLATAFEAQLRLRDATVEAHAPHIDEVTLSSPENSNVVMIDAVVSELHGPIEAVGFVARDDLGQSLYRQATKAANGHWTAAFLLTNGATELNYLLVEAANATAVGYWTNDGYQPQIKVDVVDPLLALTLSSAAGQDAPTGIYLGPVDVVIDGQPNATYVAVDREHAVDQDGDGNPDVFASGDTFTILGDGAHEVEVFGTDGSYASRVFAIDASVPQVSVITPAELAEFRSGDIAYLHYESTDQGTGADCVATVNGEPIDNDSPLPTDTVGDYTIVVTCTDLVGHTGTATLIYSVASRYTWSGFYSPTSNIPQVNVLSPSSTIALKWDVFVEGVEQTSLSIIDSIYWYELDSFASGQRIDGPFTTPATEPQYSGFYHFNVDAPSTSGDFEVVVRLDDGSELTAYFRVK